jgi:hypothetical protein
MCVLAIKLTQDWVGKTVVKETVKGKTFLGAYYCTDVHLDPFQA